MNLGDIGLIVIPIFVMVLFALVVIVPITIDLYEINKNEKQYGEELNNYDLQRKWDCFDFCGNNNVRFIPSTLFTQEVCECR